MTRTLWTWGRPVGAAAILAAVLWTLGTGPFVDGLRAVDAQALAAAAAIGAVTTVCCAWRWTIVARGLGVGLPLAAAVPAYYRSMFLNLSLPGGVVGDVHRGVVHGRDVRDVGRGVRAVAWERTAGQTVQAVLAVAVLLVLPSPVRSSMPYVGAALVATVLALALVSRMRPVGGPSRLRRLRAAVAADLRDGLLARSTWPPIVLASAVAVLGFALTFLLAARTAGVDAPASELLPLGLLAMLAMVLPSVAGWGPREGATAWAFAAAGLGADAGVATAVVFGVLVLAASLPGAVVLGLTWLPRARPASAVRPGGAADA
jgi:hypothetical protein